MKKLLWSIMMLTITGIYSCKNEIESPEPEIEPNATGYFIYKERDPNSPLILSQRTPREQTRALVAFDELLGHSFKVQYYPYETMHNVGYPVVDIKKLEEENSSWTRDLPLRESYTKPFAYADYDQYEKNSEITKKVESGFELNLGLFKIGKKKTMEEKFTQSLLTSSKSVMGQLDIEIRDKIYELHTNSNIMNQIKTNYIHKDFRNDLYNMPISELIDDYGPFVLKNFITGGRATALYAGIHRSSTSSNVKEESMEKSINASFSAKKDTINGSFDYGIGRGFSNGTEINTSFSQMEVSIKTVGGAYGYPTFTPSLSFDNFSVDLSSWVSSLNSDNTHTVVDIQNDGLIPLHSFLLEENFKEQYKRVLEGEELSFPNLIEPKLYYIVYSEHETLHAVAIWLRTRFGDILNLELVYYEDCYFQDIENELYNKVNRYVDVYKINCEYDMPNVFNTHHFFLHHQTSLLDHSTEIKEDHMLKYHNSENGMLYLLYNANGNKVGYSLFIGHGDYLLDTYGIREWVETLPETSLSYAELIQYTLIGL